MAEKPATVYVVDSESFRYLNGEVYFGRQIPWSQVSDFFVDPTDGKVHMRKLLLQDQGDPPDLMLGRAGPDGANPIPFTRPEQVTPGQNLGTISWRGYQENGGFGPRSAQIYCRYEEGGGGSLHLAVATHVDSSHPDATMRDVVVLEQDGTLNLAGVPFDGERIKVRTPDGRLGWLRVEFDG